MPCARAPRAPSGSPGAGRREGQGEDEQAPELFFLREMRDGDDLVTNLDLRIRLGHDDEILLCCRLQ